MRKRRKFKFVGGEDEKKTLCLNSNQVTQGKVYEEIELEYVSGDTKGFVTNDGVARYFCFDWLYETSRDVADYWQEVK